MHRCTYSQPLLPLAGQAPGLAPGVRCLPRRRRGSAGRSPSRPGMSAPDISRIEESPGGNLTLGTMVKLFRGSTVGA